MEDFLLFVDDLRKRFPIHIEIGYNKTVDWCICVVKRGCAEDYPGSKHIGNDAVLVQEQDIDMQLCFAKAHVALKEWLLEHDGGY